MHSLAALKVAFTFEFFETGLTTLSEHKDGSPLRAGYWPTRDEISAPYSFWSSKMTTGRREVVNPIGIAR
jgi:hypothetical protein